MRILIVSPAPSGSRVGNRVTALRMAGLLRCAGHQVKLRGAYEEHGAELVFCLHALKSAPAVRAAKATDDARPVVLVLTGTDLYEDIAIESEAQGALELADRLVVLQPRAVEQLPEAVRGKARLVLQSARAPREEPATDTAPAEEEHFDVCVLAHLRPIKEPLLAARAARRLPPSSRIRVLLVGGALDDASHAEARAEAERNPRLQWLGELPRGQALRVLARSKLLALTSRNEGGPAAVTEAIACGVPVLSTRIPAAEGLLGSDHPGLFPVGDEAALAELLQRAEQDEVFLSELRERSARLAPSVDPRREQGDLEALIAEFTNHS